MNPIGQLTHTRRSDGAPAPDGALKTVARSKIIHYRQLYLNRPDPFAFMPVVVHTSGRIYDDFSRLFFSFTHRESSTLSNELPEESDQFRFLRADSLPNLKWSLGLILSKTSVMRISIPLDLSSWSCIPLPCFIRSSRSTPLLAPSLVFRPRCSAKSAHEGYSSNSFIGFSTHHSCSVTLFTLGFLPFLFR